MHTLRTKFKNEIIVEFLPPILRTQSKSSNKAIIFCDGVPTVPSKKALLEFFSKKGYWVFHPRYRGTWESGGSFLKKSPAEDILDVISGFSSGFKDLWSGKNFKFEPKKIYVLGSSFGGAMSILASRDPRVTKVVALSPAVDWKAKNNREDLMWLKNFVENAFGQAYRFSQKDWQKLKSGKFYNPINHAGEIGGNKIFIIHAKDDDVVNWKPVESFARKVKCKFVLLKKGGHLSLSEILKPRFYKKIKKFLFS